MKGLGKFRGKIFFTFLISFLIILSDQISKSFLNHQLYLGQSLPVVKNIFHITLVYNTGIAFGLFKHQTAVFTLLSLTVIGILLVNIFREAKCQKFDFTSWIALSLILGGAIGNLLDRLRFGYVIDFLDFRIWPVFNIADSCITIGAILIGIQCIQSFVKSDR